MYFKCKLFVYIDEVTLWFNLNSTNIKGVPKNHRESKRKYLLNNSNDSIIFSINVCICKH